MGLPAKYIDLDAAVDGGILSYRQQVARGWRRDGPVARLRYLARANYAYNYIFWLRRRSNDPAYVARGGAIERRVNYPLRFKKPAQSERAAEFLNHDYHFAPKMIAPDLVSAFAADLARPQVYHDPYRRDFSYEGPAEGCAHPFLYMDPYALVRNENFLRICASPDLIAFCREVLGPNAALSWAWSWISRPTELPYQNQNWHRDSAEPFNFIRVFVPLGPVESLADGPTEFIPATAQRRQFFEPRRFADSELAQLKASNGAGTFLCEPGDTYFLNTFALHRGNPPSRQRAVLSLLVSLSPSHRTPAIAKLDRRALPPELRKVIDRNKRFFRYLL